MTVTGGPITTGAWRRIRAWRDAWIGLGTATVPTLVADGGPPITGRAVLRWLEKQITHNGAPPAPDLGDPSRYPSMAVRPSPEWVSQVGGPWAHAWKTSP